MGIFLSYVFLGLSLAAPIGPINAAQLDRGIKDGFLHSWLIGLGSVCADIIYMLFVYFGIVHILEASIVQAFLWSFGCFVLVYTGIESFVTSAKITDSDWSRQSHSLVKTFGTGFFMSLSNPLTILFWLGIYGSVLAKTATSYDNAHLIIYSSAIVLGLMMWDVTMALIASHSRKILNNRVLATIAAFSGLSLIGFGLYFGYQAYQILF